MELVRFARECVEGEGVRVLDVGAAMMGESSGLGRYVAYCDPRFVKAEAREVAMAAAGYCEDLAQVRARLETQVDVVMMAGTLHAVPVEEWLGLFRKLGECVRPGAVAVIVEDQAPRVVERGLVILEHAEWEAMVGKVEERRLDSLTAFRIPVARLAAISTDQLGRTMGLVAARCLNEVKHTDQGHAFYAMMHMMATLAAGAHPASAPRRRHRDTF